jgi:Xaa-Pro aminopeptidase
MNLSALQASIGRAGLDGWLFFDHHQRDLLAYRILGLSPELHVSRRWYYFVPASGDPRKLVSRIEPRVLDGLPGEQALYSGWPEQHAKLQRMLHGSRRIAMQYSPECAVPYVSMIDAGTLELVRKSGVDVVTSADLVAEFEAAWSADQLNFHLEAAKRVQEIRAEAFDLIGHRLRSQEAISEYELQQFILLRFAQQELVTDHGPIVAVNEHSGNPHFEPDSNNDRAIKPGDFVLLDMWAKLNRPEAVYADITWTGYCGENIPAEIQNVFEVVRDARTAACDFVVQVIGERQRVAGFEVDDAARGVIEKRGYGEAFIHRTGHSIGTEVHGTGANMDNFESHDERSLIPNTCFSVEPGIYLPQFGVRSEVDVFVGSDRAYVTTEEQQQIVRI